MARKLTAKQESYKNNRIAGMGVSDLDVYYVYHFVDPRNQSVFYIGKGKGNRIHQHERDAFSYAGLNECKESIIRDIVNSGNDVSKEIIETFVSEQDAYDFEYDQIASYGLRSLTNKMPGGGTARNSFSRVVMRDLVDLLYKFNPSTYIFNDLSLEVATCFWDSGYDREKNDMIAKDRPKFIKELDIIIEEKYSGWFIEVGHGTTN